MLYASDMLIRHYARHTLPAYATHAAAATLLRCCLRAGAYADAAAAAFLPKMLRRGAYAALRLLCHVVELFR